MRRAEYHAAQATRRPSLAGTVPGTYEALAVTGRRSGRPDPDPDKRSMVGTDAEKVDIRRSADDDRERAYRAPGLQ